MQRPHEPDGMHELKQLPLFFLMCLSSSLIAGANSYVPLVQRHSVYPTKSPCCYCYTATTTARRSRSAALLDHSLTTRSADAEPAPHAKRTTSPAQPDHHRSPSYRIVGAPFSVCENANHILPVLVDVFDFPSTTQARKSMRHGEFVILRPPPPSLVGAATVTTSSGKRTTALSPLDATVFDNGHADLLKNRTILAVEPFSPILQGDLVARITRVPNEWVYPVEQSGYVRPPTLERWPEIVYQDDHVAVVNKPEGLTTIGVPRQDLQSVLPFLLSPPEIADDYGLPRPVHRLDRRTSGLVLVAKTKKSMRLLSKAFEERSVLKTYTALVFGAPIKDSGIVQNPVSGKEAVSEWQVRKRSEFFSLLQVKPKTGRLHQIRRHLSYCLDSPIVGDNKYDNGRFKEYRSKGLFLCSNKVSFVHPTTGKQISLSIPIPPKFEELLTSINQTVSQSIIPEDLNAQIERVRVELGDKFETDEGMQCTGEPQVDPSRMIDPNQGDSEWIEDW